MLSRLSVPHLPMEGPTLQDLQPASDSTGCPGPAADNEQCFSEEGGLVEFISL
jgi:hypothetical protein